MEKRKIVFTISKPIIGGAQVWLKNILDLINQEQLFEVHVITSSEGWLSDNCKGVKFHFVKNFDRMSFSAILKTITLVRKISPATIVANSAYAGFYSRLASFSLGVKSIYVSHGWSAIYNGSNRFPYFIFIEHILSYMTTTILCVSESDAQSAISDIKIPKRKIKVIRNRVPLGKSINRGNAKSPKKILFVGRLEYPKRPDLFTLLADKFSDLEFYVVGDGSLKNSLKTSSNVTFLGEVHGFDDYSNYDAFVLLSDSEGLPVSALEAGSCGLPMLLSDVGGCNELISTSSPNGVLTTNEVETLYTSFQSLMDSYSLFQDNALILRKNYDISELKQQYINVFNAI